VPVNIRSSSEADEARCKYYAARADRVEMEVAELRANLISAQQIESDLRAFCAVIEARVRKSQISAELQKELAEDLGDFLHKISLNGKNGKSNTKRRSAIRSR
jgi:hypothetical protein